LTLKLSDVYRVATDVASTVEPPLDVVAATPSNETYSEILLTVRGCRTEPCRILVGVSRAISEADLRDALRHQLLQRLAEHGQLRMAP
jgi:hypothetical protein